MLPVLPVRLKDFFEHRTNYSSAKIDIDDGIVCRFDPLFRVTGMYLILLALAGWLYSINTFQGTIHNASVWFRKQLGMCHYQQPLLFLPKAQSRRRIRQFSAILF